MADKFDPYHKWLGIPPREQPANYYRLLGLELFEQDVDAIEAAADRLLNYVRDVAKVEHRKEAREVLDELTTAKQCLLIAEQKQAYDAGLRAGRVADRQSRQPGPRRKQPPLAQTVAAPTVTTKSRPTRQQTKPSRSPVRMIAAASVLGFIGMGVVCVSVFFPSSDSRRQGTEVSPIAGQAQIDAKPNLVEPRPAEDAMEPDSSDVPEPEVQTVAFEVAEPTVDSSRSEMDSEEFGFEQRDVVEKSNVEPRELELPTALGDEPDSNPSEHKEEVTPLDPKSELTASDEVARTDERGSLLREIWHDVAGNKVEQFIEHVTEHPEPDQTETIDQFETPEDFDDQYGQRLRGYLYPPVTGTYEFSIRANAEGWLYLSTDATPDHKRLVEPKAAIDLSSDQVYYVEAFHKESTGKDHLSIGWKLPDGTEEKPIPGKHLSVHYRIAPQHESEFIVLKPLSVESSAGTILDVTDDGQVVATGSTSGNETYRLTFTPDMASITALRIEAIPHERLPAGGPGRGIGGRFTLAQITAAMQQGDAAESAEVLSFSSASDDEARDLRRIIDGNEKTFWRMSGRGEQAAVTLIVQNPTSRSDATLRVNLVQRESIGRFRVLATSAPNPQIASRPAVAASSGSAHYSLFVNLGGDEFTAPDGTRWRASTLFDNETFGHEGGRGVTEELIDNKVQGSALRGIKAFRAVVPEGTYEVTLYFCEYWSTSPDSRRFAIAAEQRAVTRSFDLMSAAGGFAKPLVYPIRNVLVNDGRLDIQFQPTSENASTILNAIRIERVR